MLQRAVNSRFCFEVFIGSAIAIIVEEIALFDGWLICAAY